MTFVIIVFSMLLSAHTALAGMVLSINEAEGLLLEKSLDVKAKKTEMQKADASVIGAKALPNPALRYFYESVENGARETEQTYSMSQNVDITGTRGRRVEAAATTRESRALFLAHEISGLTVRMKQSYYRILLLKENERALSEIAGVFSDVERKTAARVGAGDASEADLMKLTNEKNRVLRGLETVRTDLKVELRRLALLLNIEQTDFDISGRLSFVPMALDVQELTEAGQRNNPALKGQGRLVEASDVLLSAAEKAALPSFDLEGGYKTRTGGFSGFVFGISVPLPLFDRNQGGIAHAQAERAQQEVTLEAMKKNTAFEITLLFEQIASLQARIALLSHQVDTARQLTRIAGIAYEEGETGLLDLLDAARSERELIIEYHTAVYEHWSSVFDLERATGTTLTGRGGAK